MVSPRPSCISAPVSMMLHRELAHGDIERNPGAGEVFKSCRGLAGQRLFKFACALGGLHGDAGVGASSHSWSEARRSENENACSSARCFKACRPARHRRSALHRFLIWIQSNQGAAPTTFLPAPTVSRFSSRKAATRSRRHHRFQPINRPSRALPPARRDGDRHGSQFLLEQSDISEHARRTGRQHDIQHAFAAATARGLPPKVEHASPASCRKRLRVARHAPIGNPPPRLSPATSRRA